MSGSQLDLSVQAEFYNTNWEAQYAHLKTKGPKLYNYYNWRLKVQINLQNINIFKKKIDSILQFCGHSLFFLDNKYRIRAFNLKPNIGYFFKKIILNICWYDNGTRGVKTGRPVLARAKNSPACFKGGLAGRRAKNRLAHQNNKKIKK